MNKKNKCPFQNKVIKLNLITDKVKLYINNKINNLLGDHSNFTYGFGIKFLKLKSIRNYLNEYYKKINNEELLNLLDSNKKDFEKEYNVDFYIKGLIRGFSEKVYNDFKNQLKINNFENISNINLKEEYKKYGDYYKNNFIEVLVDNLNIDDKTSIIVQKVGLYLFYKMLKSIEKLKEETNEGKILYKHLLKKESLERLFLEDSIINILGVAIDIINTVKSNQKDYSKRLILESINNSKETFSGLALFTFYKRESLHTNYIISENTFVFSMTKREFGIKNFFSKKGGPLLGCPLLFMKKENKKNQIILYLESITGILYDTLEYEKNKKIS